MVGIFPTSPIPVATALRHRLTILLPLPDRRPSCNTQFANHTHRRRRQPTAGCQREGLLFFSSLFVSTTPVLHFVSSESPMCTAAQISLPESRHHLLKFAPRRSKLFSGSPSSLPHSVPLYGSPPFPAQGLPLPTHLPRGY